MGNNNHLVGNNNSTVGPNTSYLIIIQEDQGRCHSHFTDEILMDTEVVIHPSPSWDPELSGKEPECKASDT